MMFALIMTSNIKTQYQKKMGGGGMGARIKKDEFVLLTVPAK